jgi:hypothetical protein
MFEAGQESAGCISEDIRDQMENTHVLQSVRKFVGKGDSWYNWKGILMGEGECVDEMIENVKPNEYVRDGSERLQADTTPASICEEQSAVHNKAFKQR